MIEAGLIQQWIDDLVGTKAMKAREQYSSTAAISDWAKNLQQNVSTLEFFTQAHHKADGFIYGRVSKYILSLNLFNF